MSSSPTPSLETNSTIGQLWTCLATWELSVSLDESFTKMAEFTTTYSLISDGSFRQERLTYSMWEATTQTSSLLVELRRRLTTTHARMETLLQEGLEDRAEIAIATLIASGVRRHMRDLLRNFCTFAISWLREISSEDFPRFAPILTGNGIEFQNTINPRELSLTRQQLRESTSGCHSLILELAEAERGELDTVWKSRSPLGRGLCLAQTGPLPLTHASRGAPGHPLLSASRAGAHPSLHMC